MLEIETAPCKCRNKENKKPVGEENKSKPEIVKEPLRATPEKNVELEQLQFNRAPARQWDAQKSRVKNPQDFIPESKDDDDQNKCAQQ